MFGLVLLDDGVDVGATEAETVQTHSARAEALLCVWPWDQSSRNLQVLVERFDCWIQLLEQQVGWDEAMLYS